MEIPHSEGRLSGSSNRLVQFLSRYALGFYFLLAFAFSWAYELTVYQTVFTPGSLLGDLGFTLGPTLAAFLMTSVTLGRAGVQRLLRRYVLWRVGISWYLLALLGVPALVLIAVLSLPGAFSAFRLPGLAFWPGYLVSLLIAIFAWGPFFEEPGWRGFALPRMEPRMGPLAGTLVLGVLWGLWHLPLFFIPGTDQYTISLDASIAGHLAGFLLFSLEVIALAIILTWVFNNTRGTLILVMLVHASINTANGILLPKLFPSLSATPPFVLSQFLVWVAAALLLVAATRGRLSYRRYLREADPGEIGVSHAREKTGLPPAG
jgi:membrane protease YdiL (CAAX protease family)